MRSTFFLLVACLASSGHGRRVQQPKEEQMQSNAVHDDSQKEALAMLLSAFQPSAGFQVGAAANGLAHVPANARQKRVVSIPAMEAAVSSKPAIEGAVLDFVDADGDRISFKPGESILGGYDYYCDGKLRHQGVQVQSGIEQGFDVGSLLLFTKSSEMSDVVIPKDKDMFDKTMELLPQGMAPTESEEQEPPNMTAIFVGSAVLITALLVVLLATAPYE